MSEEFDESSIGFLDTKAYELAQSHHLSTAKPTPIPLLVNLSAMPGWFKQVKNSLNTTDIKTARVAEWIFDNSYLLNRALQQIKLDMPANYYTLLPSIQGKMSDEHLPRAYRIAGGFLAADGIQIALPIIVEFIKAYQKVSPLDISELWALPSFLRLVCIELVVAVVVKMVPEITLPYGDSIARKPIETSLDEVDCLGRAIHCLATIETIPWQKFFERVNVVEEELRRDPCNAYAKLDFDSRNRYCHVIEYLARSTSYGEQAIAQQVVGLANDSITQGERYSHVGYWLVDDGRETLEAELGYRPSWFGRCKRGLQRHNTSLYFFLLFSMMFITLSVAALYLAQNEADASEYFWGLLLSMIPASMIAVSLANWIVTTLKQPWVLNKMNFDKGIDPDCATAVVIPTLLGSVDDVDTLLAQIERHYLCNPDPALSFVLLTDFPDAATRVLPSDDALLRHMREGVVKLNLEHRGAGKGMFHLLHRQRRYNPSEGCWMGWERKRGKLDAFNRLLSGETNGEFSLHEGDVNGLSNIRFVITLDSDTQLFRGVAARLIGTLAHPLNRAVFDDETGKILAGYTIIQPRIEIDPSHVNNTRFSRIATGDRVIDIYTRAVSEVYQDLFGCGIFVGKGIYDLAAFKRSLAQSIPENTVLSHDLLEGILGRTALASDIVLYEDFPTQYLAFTRRLHRWIRGDWQLIPWLRKRVRISGNSIVENGSDKSSLDKAGIEKASTEKASTEKGSSVKNKFKPIDRWKIIDNLRRSLFSPMLLLWFFAGWLWLPGSPLVWTILALLAPIGHNIGNIVFGVISSASLTGLLKPFSESMATLQRWLMLIAFLPHESIAAIDAIARTLYRLTVSRKNLLQWVVAAQIDKELKNTELSQHFFFGEKWPSGAC